MNGISIASIYFDLQGCVSFPRLAPGASMDAGARRLTKYALLEGGVAAYDGGYHEGDESLDFSVEPATPDQIATVRRLRNAYAELRITLDRGVFIGCISQMEARDGRLDVSIELYRRVSA